MECVRCCGTVQGTKLYKELGGMAPGDRIIG